MQVEVMLLEEESGVGLPRSIFSAYKCVSTHRHVDGS